MRYRRLREGGILVICLSLVVVVLLAAADARADVDLAILPSIITVDQGEIFDVELTVTSASSAFSGYDAVITYDPTAIAFLEQSRELQEGPLMTDACRINYHEFSAPVADSTLHIRHILNCGGAAVTGPGVVYRLRFMAGSEDRTTFIRIAAGVEFVLAGTDVGPVTTADAEVHVRAPGHPPGGRFAHDNEIGIYTEPNPTPENAEALSSYYGGPGLFEAFVVCTRPYNTNTNAPITTIGGFEFRLVLPANVYLMSRDPSGVNQSVDPDFVVRGLAFVFDERVTLMRMTLGEFLGAPSSIKLAPVQVGPSSPGNMVILDSRDNDSYSVAYPMSGDYDLPVFGIYQAVVPNEVESWGGVKALYR